MVKVFTNIKELVTLKEAHKKSARNIIHQDLSILRKASLIAVNGKIVWVGPEKSVSKKMISRFGDKVKYIDLDNQYVIPGFVECHTHSVFAGDRQNEFELRNRGMSYQQIAEQGGGILSTVKATRAASAKELLLLLQERIQNFIRQGVTTIEVKSGYGLNLGAELKLLKTITSVKKPHIVSTFLGAHAKSPDYNSYEDYLKDLVNVYLPQIAKTKLAHRADIFIDQGYFTPDQAKIYLEKAKELGLQVCLHTEQLHRTEGYKVGLTYQAQSMDHLVQINEGDIDILKNSNTTAVLLPSADFYLKMKYPPARKLIDSGVRVAISTDFNPGTSPSPDLSLVGVLSRLNMNMSLPETVVAYTLGAAYALGLENQVGSLEVGKSCDFCVLDNSWESLFYQVGIHPVKQTWWKAQKIF